MPRNFVSASNEYVGFTPRAFDAWSGVMVGTLARRNASGVFHTLYYTGAIGGSVNGNMQMGINSTNDLYYGATSFAGTVAAANNYMGAAKATGTATPRADYNQAPFLTGWIHSNMAATEANPATTAGACEEIGRWNGTNTDLYAGDIEWFGIWGFSPQFTGNQSESMLRLAPRFLPSMLPQCQRFWWFNQPISDTVRDLSNHLADQTARNGTTHVVQVPLMPNLAGTTFSVVPGVL